MRILAIKLSSLGDLFHVLPAVHCLRAGLNASIHWVTQPQYVELVRCFNDVDRVIAFHRNAFLGNIPGFLSELRTEEYELIVDFQGLWKSALVACLARGARRVGPSFHREGARLVYSSVAGPANRNRHAVDQALDVVGHLAVPTLPPEFPAVFPDVPVEGQSPKVALVPFSRRKNKNWPAVSFARLAGLLRARADATVFLLGGPDDAAACEAMARRSFAHNLAGKLTLPELGGFLKKMDLVISNDSGPMHMAAAVGTPVLALFGPTDPLRTCPYGTIHRVMSAKLECSPCRSRTCRYKDSFCLSVLAPEAVGDAAIRMLERRDAKKSKIIIDKKGEKGKVSSKRRYTSNISRNS